MKELKFRLWDGLNNKMSFWMMNDLCNYTDESTEKPSALEEWMQYVGIYDKNKKDIYEGDIVEIDKYGKYKVIYIDNKMTFFFDTIEGNDRQFTATDDMIEVIGNIYENQDLLVNNKK